MTRAELAGLLQDPRWYMEHLLVIRDKRQRMVPLALNPAQKELYELILREREAGRPVRVVILKARQLGMSTMVEGMFFQDAATRALVRTMIVAHDGPSTGALFRMNDLFYDQLPAPVKPMRRYSNARELQFDNPSRDPARREELPGLRSSIQCVPASGVGVARGTTLTNVHASEAAFWDDMDATLDALLQAVPGEPDTAVVVESTANGFNAFKRFWDDAVAGKNAFVPVFLAWYKDPEYRRRVPPDTEWTAEELAMQEAYGLDEEQLAWRRWCIAANLRGDAERFKQEYPSCPEEAFLASGDPFFDNAVIMLRLQTAPEPVATGRWVYGEEENGRPIDPVWQEDPEGEIRIYAAPEERAPYVFGGDTAGDGSDRFTGFGLDNRTGGQTVQLLYDGNSELWYAQQMYCLGRHYNDALLAVEINFSTYPERMLELWGYPNLYIREKTDDARRELAVHKLGWRTDPRTRPLMLANLRTVAAQTPGCLMDRQLLEEMLSFIRNEDMRPEAAQGEHDDMVIAAAITHFVRPQQRYEELPTAVEAHGKLIDRLDPGHKKRR